VEYKVPNPASDPITLFHPARAVVIQMVPLEMPEVAIAKLSEMQEIVDPLFTDVALHDTRKQGGQSIHGEQKAQGRGHGKERQDILQLTTNVPAVKRSFMMFPVKRVEPLVKKAANQALAWRKAAVQDVTMEEIFHQAPHRDSRQIKEHPDPRVPGAQAKERHDHRVRGVEGCQWIEPTPCDSGLFAFVGFERTLGRPIDCRCCCQSCRHKSPPGERVPLLAVLSVVSGLFETAGHALEGVRRLFPKPLIHREARRESSICAEVGNCCNSGI
jgi:hypothetical protein